MRSALGLTLSSQNRAVVSLQISRRESTPVRRQNTVPQSRRRCAGGKFVVSRAGEAYDLRARSIKRKFLELVHCLTVEVSMRFLFVTMIASLLIVASATAQQAPRGPAANPAVTGMIKSFDGKTLVLDAKDGAISIGVTSTTRITVNVPKKLTDIKPGDFIASGGTRGPDGTLRANEIRIFPAPAGEGQFPMAQPGQTMTNATVMQVMTNATVQQVGSSGSPVIKLTFHGAGAPGSADCTGRAADAPGGAGTGCVGETAFEVPANVPVVAVVPADPSMLKVGTKVTVNTVNAADGSSSAARISISQ